jgi:hypothetical protein
MWPIMWAFRSYYTSHTHASHEYPPLDDKFVKECMDHMWCSIILSIVVYVIIRIVIID